MENYSSSQFESREMGERVPKCEIPRKRGVGNLSLRIDDSKAEGETGLILNFEEGEDATFALSHYFSMTSPSLPWFSQNPRRGPGVAPNGITTIIAKEELCL
jgi:hypothetical protein